MAIFSDILREGTWEVFDLHSPGATYIHTENLCFPCRGNPQTLQEGNTAVQPLGFHLPP